MALIRFITDEDVYGSVAAKLRERGLDAVSTPEARRLGESDRSQLEWAAQQGRAILTFNVAHFATLHHEWLSLSQRHSGIIVSSQRPIGDLLRRVVALAASLEGEEIRDRLEFLSAW